MSFLHITTSGTSISWLNHEWIDPGSQLAWLSGELLAAESAGEKVHIVSHIFGGGGSSLGAWGREYNRLISRFEDTIAAQYFGHSHKDEFLVYYDTETNSRAVSVGYITPSVGTRSNLNPSYRIFTVDGEYDGSSWV